MTFNIDTIISTLVAGALVLLLGFWAVRSMSKDTGDHVPTKLQILWEPVVGEVNKQVEDNLGKVHPFVAPLAISLFFFILFCNWLELLPTELINGHDVHLLPAPDRRHQPDLRARRGHDAQRLDLRHPPEGLARLLQALRRAVPGAARR